MNCVGFEADLMHALTVWGTQSVEEKIVSLPSNIMMMAFSRVLIRGQNVSVENSGLEKKCFDRKTL